MLKSLARASHIWRGVDPAEPSNRFALLTFAVATVVGTVLVATTSDTGLGGALLDGLRYGVGAFLAWAVARELDPDHSASARFAVATYVAVAFTGTPDLAAVVAVLLALRLVVRTTGRPPTRIDLAVVVAVGGIAATSTAGFVTALALAWAVYVDARLPEAAPERESEVGAALTAAVAVAVTMLSGGLFATEWGLPGALATVVIVATAVAGLSLRATEVRAAADRTRLPLSLERLVHGRRLTLVVLVAALLWSGGSAVGALGPVFAAVIGVGLFSTHAVERVSEAISRD